MWPLSDGGGGGGGGGGSGGGSAAEATVTVRIDQLRDRSAAQICGVYKLEQGVGWFVTRRAEREAAVEKLPLGAPRAQGAMMLAFWRLQQGAGGGGTALLPPPLAAAGRPGLEESAADRIEERRAFRFDITTLQPSAAAEWRAAPAAQGPKRG